VPERGGGCGRGVDGGGWLARRRCWEVLRVVRAALGLPCVSCVVYRLGWRVVDRGVGVDVEGGVAPQEACVWGLGVRVEG